MVAESTLLFCAVVGTVCIPPAFLFGSNSIICISQNIPIFVIPAALPASM